MALTPINLVIDTEEITETEAQAVEVEPSLTFKLDVVNGRLGGLIDGTEAIKQFIGKAVSTARVRYLIYDDSYGCEVADLMEQSLPLAVIETEVPRFITESLIYDDRIEDVTNFNLTQTDENVRVSFQVVLTSGEAIESEVNL